VKLGLNRNTAHRVIYGPSRYSGLGFRDLFAEQGIRQVKLLVQHLRTSTTQGTLMQIALSWWQLVAGVSYPLLTDTSMTLPHPDSHWLSSLRTFLSTMNASIHVDGLALPTLLRDVGVCIMEAIHQLPGLTKTQLRAFDRCRIYFGVIYVSEIGTADGRNISRKAWDSSCDRLSPLLWLYQPKPGPKSFQTWRCLLLTAFLLGHRPIVSYQTRDLRLRRPLGRWRPSSNAFRYHWRSFYAASTNTLFALSSDDRTFTSHSPLRARRRPKHQVRAFSFDSMTQVTILPADSVPVDYAEEPNKHVIPDTLPTLLQDRPAPATALAWTTYLQTLPLWDRELLSSVEIVDRTRLFTALRQDDQLHLASDGGAVDKMGSYRALMATHEHILVECGGRAQGSNP
jgi:hypothetical protein